MKVFITSAYEINQDNYVSDFLKKSSQNDPFKIHELTHDPEEADVLIFAEHHPGDDPYFFKIAKNKFYLKHKHKCYLYHDSDYNLTFIPTITPSVERSHFNPHFHKTFSYIIQLDYNPYISCEKPKLDRKYLFSFVGAARTNFVREKIMNLNCNNCYTADTSLKNSWDLSGREKEEYLRSYADISFNSKFILCPRGIGPNTYRLYESLKMGIAPIIISDEWVPTDGPNWNDFSIRVQEADIDNIPKILENKADDYYKMGQLARKAWEDYFADDKHFHYLIESCLDLHNSRTKLTYISYLKQFLRFFEPFHARNLLRYLKKKIKI